MWYAELLREVTWLPEVPAHVLQSMQEHASLDADQAEALAAAVTKELTLIQGPPGTGGPHCLSNAMACIAYLRT